MTDQRKRSSISSENYRPSKDVFELVRRCSTPSMLVPILLSMLDHILIWLPIAVVFSVFSAATWSLIFCLPLLFVVSARSMRGLECLVHDASHYSWSRKYKKLNDVIANCLVAYPMLSTVDSYRNSHLLHHNAFSTDDDPDFERHQILRFDEFDRSNFWSTAVGVAERFWPYFFSWWRAIGTDVAIFGKFLTWHFVTISLITLINQDIYYTLLVWTFAFGIPFLLILPILRMIGEAAEHDYENQPGQQSLTFSNIGFFQELVFHPHNDGFHTLHHAFPQVPHFRLARLHSSLNELPGSGWRSYVRVRSGLFAS